MDKRLKAKVGHHSRKSCANAIFQNTYVRRVISSLGSPINLYDTLLPLHTATKLLGLSPHTLKFTNGKPSYEVSVIGSCYSITCILAFVAYYVFAVEERKNVNSVETNKIANAIDMYQLYGSVMVMTLAVFNNSLNQKTLIEAISELVSIDVKITHQNLKINYVHSRNLIAVYILVILIACGAMEYMNCSMFLRQIGTLSTYCLFMCYVPMVVNGLLECQFICYLLLLGQRFSILNNELHMLRPKKKFTRTTKIFKIAPLINDLQSKATLVRLTQVRKIHSELCFVGKLLNNVFSLPILLDIGNVFINFTTLGFYCFDGCVKIYLEEPDTNFYNTITTGIWTLFKLMQLFAISLVCCVVKNEAHMAGEIIYKMENRFEPEYSSEIYSFGKQIMHWNFKFTAFDFFEIDMSLFYSAVCSATTYLMILLQLDIANKQIENSLKKLQA